ncbi:MAG: acyl-CoA thioesterase domain-containing protein [Actinomycetota bacterium]
MTPRPGGETGHYLGDPNPYGVMGIYGGHFVAQALAAGFATVEEPKTAHSLHAYFLRKGDPEEPIEYRVTALRDGRGSSARSIAASQHGQVVFQMMASFKLPEPGDLHQPEQPAVASAEELIAAREASGEPAFPFPPTQNGWVQAEWVTPSFRDYIPDRRDGLTIWARVPGADELDERQRQVVLAYLSDVPIVFNAVVAHGVPFETHMVTSLDHSLWFHRAVDPSGWLLYDQASSAAADSRGLNEGRLFAADGRLVMTCVQESMLRRMAPPG